MRLRTWFSIVALFGLLLHAAAIVRHNAVMLDATLQYNALVADLAQICHGGAATAKAPATELPFVPRPADAGNNCPLCSGLSPVFALIEPQAAGTPVRLPVALQVESDAVAVPVLPYAAHPPARGPPRLV